MKIEVALQVTLTMDQLCLTRAAVEAWAESLLKASDEGVRETGQQFRELAEHLATYPRDESDDGPKS